MSDRRTIVSLGFGVTAGILALAGLLLLVAPGIARGLGRPNEPVPWALDRREAAAAPTRLLEASGLHVSETQRRRNHEAWNDMSDGERAKLRRSYARLCELDPAARDQLVTRYKSLQDLPEDERARLSRGAANLARFEASLGRQDRAVLDGLSPKDRARHLVDLWRASPGLD